MKILTASTPQWFDQAQTVITLQAQFKELAFVVPFAASMADTEQHGKDLFTRAVAGEFGAIAAYVPPSTAEVQAATNADAKKQIADFDAASVRAIREFILAKFGTDTLLNPVLAVKDSAAATQRARIK